MSDKIITANKQKVHDYRKAEEYVANSDDDDTRAISSSSAVHDESTLSTCIPNPTTTTTKVFKVVHGTYKFSRFAAFSILIPEGDADRVHAALSTSTNQHHEWTIAEEGIDADDIPSIPSCLGFLVPPTCTAFPETIHDGKKKLSEDEVLNMILTRGSVPVKKWAVCHLKRKQLVNGNHREFVWLEFGLLCIEFNDGHQQTCDEAIKYLKKIVQYNSTICRDFSESYCYYIKKVEMWGESEMMVKKNVLDIKYSIESSDDWLKEFKEKCDAELSEERRWKREKDHRGRLLDARDRVLRWILPDDYDY